MEWSEELDSSEHEEAIKLSDADGIRAGALLSSRVVSCGICCNSRKSHIVDFSQRLGTLELGDSYCALSMAPNIESRMLGAAVTIRGIEADVNVLGAASTRQGRLSDQDIRDISLHADLHSLRHILRLYVLISISILNSNTFNSI